jgi:hypothetical protein
LFQLFGFLIVLSLVLAACAPKATPTQPPPPAETQAPPPAQTEAPAVTETEAPAEPTPPPTTRKGGWLDEVVFTVVDRDSAIPQIQAGAIDIFRGCGKTIKFYKYTISWVQN